LQSLLLAFVWWSAMKTSWGTCMVEDVVACAPLPHACIWHTSFIWLFISFMRSPSFVLGYGGWFLLHNFPF
jgi:hypothetical protein